MHVFHSLSHAPNQGLADAPQPYAEALTTGVFGSLV